MTPDPRRLQRDLRRLSVRGTAAVRRRPWAAAVVTVAAVLAIAAVTSLYLLRANPPAPVGSTVTAPTFTFVEGWSLVELQRHVEAGEVTAITAAEATGPSGQPDPDASRPDERRPGYSRRPDGHRRRSGLGAHRARLQQSPDDRGPRGQQASDRVRLEHHGHRPAGRDPGDHAHARPADVPPERLGAAREFVIPNDHAGGPTRGRLGRAAGRGPADRRGPPGRRRRLRRSEARADRDDRVPQIAGAVPQAGRAHSARHHAVRTPRHRQDHAGPRRRGRGRRAVPPRLRVRVRREVRRRRREARPRYVRPGPETRTRRHLL